MKGGGEKFRDNALEDTGGRGSSEKKMLVVSKNKRQKKLLWVTQESK